MKYGFFVLSIILTILVSVQLSAAAPSFTSIEDAAVPEQATSSPCLLDLPALFSFLPKDRYNIFPSSEKKDLLSTLDRPLEFTGRGNGFVGLEIPKEGHDSGAPDTLESLEAFAQKVTNPTSLQNIIQISDYYSPSYLGSAGDGNVVRLYPMISIPKSKKFSFDQICRPSIPFTKLLDGTAGLGDCWLTDIFILSYKKWGKWGLGPCFVFPTASSRALGQGKWQAGPAGVVVNTQIPNWQLGLLSQNFFSVAGDPSRPNVTTSYLQPIIVYHMKKGWYFVSNAQASYEWLSNTWIVPVNAGVGKVFRIGTQPFNVNLQGEWTVYRNRDVPAPQFTLKLNIGIILLPGKKGEREE